MNKLLAMLGLCMKAGKLAYGSDMCEEKTIEKKVKLLLVAEDASENTKERFRRLANQQQIECIEMSNIDELSHQVGKRNKAVYGIMDQNFAKKIKVLFEELKGENC